MPKKPETGVDVVVTVADSHRGKIKGMASRLRSAGLGSLQVLEESGIVLGKAPASAFKRLQDVEGVIAVEKSEQVQIAPPDSKIQ